MTEDEQFALLATDGMLVKRPILIGEDFRTGRFQRGGLGRVYWPDRWVVLLQVALSHGDKWRGSGRV